MKTLNDLKKESRWAVAKVVPPRKEGQHPGKITVDPQLLLNEGKMRNLKSTEATGWVDYQTASKALTAANNALQEGKITGVIKFTFSLRITPPLVFIDVDDIQDPEASAQFKDLTKLTKGGYCEVSQSGNGLHYLIEGKLDKAHKGKTFEMYTGGRYVAFTGNQVSKTDSIPALTESEIKAIMSYCGFKWTGDKEQAKEPLFVTTPTNGRHWGADNGLTADRVLAKAIGNPDLKAVASGDYSAYNGDHSSAVQALVNSLAFYANGDAEKTDQAYRSTPSFTNDPKWDASRGETTWGAQTVAEAINYVQGKHPDHGYFPARQNPDLRVDIYTPGGSQQEQGKQALKAGLWTENYVSDYLVERHGDNLKHTTDPDKWYIYKKETGTWEADSTSAVGRMARETIDWLHEQIPTAPAGSDAEKMLSEWNKFLRKISNSSAKSRIIREAGEYLDIAITKKDFNRAGMLINTPDKAINLSTGKEIDDRKHLLFDQHTNYSPDPAMDAPRWSKFLLETFQGDTEMIRWIQKVLGYAITGETGEQVFFIMLGEGQNGKSVLASVMQKLLGNYAHSANINTFLDTGTQSGSAPTPDVVSMDGKRFVFTAEPKKYAKLDTNKIRLFTGEDTLVGRDLHEKGQREFASYFKLFISANHMLKLDMDDYSISRRVVIIPFKHIVKNKDVNQHLVDDLLEEAPAIMNWLLEGVQAWKKEGLKTHWNPVTESLASGYPQQVSEAILEFKTATDNVLRWIDDDCSLEDPDHREGTKRLYADYKQWCINNGEKPEVSRVWGRTMSKHGFKKWRSASERGFIGIKITDPADKYKTNFK